jgi:DNA polymerase V
MVFVRTSPHKGDFYSNHCVLNLPRCTQDTALLIKNALAGLSRIYRKGFHYQKAGVMLLDLSPRSGMQLGLFGRHDDSRSQALMQTMDRINRQMGRQTLHYGSEGIRYGFWQMRSSMRSPAYTTDWRALPRVR